MNTTKIDSRKTKMIAHRGVSGIECENTAAAFVAAGNRGYYGIETDVHRTSDGQYIIIHDDNTVRVSGKELSVENNDFDTLRSLILKDRFGRTRGDLRLPTLEEYLRICTDYGKIGVLELKNPFPAEDVKNILETVKKEYSLDKMIFISFDYQNLVYLRGFSKTASLQYLCGCTVDASLLEKLKAYNLDLDTEHSFLTESAIGYLHDNGIKVNCWTVDDKSRAEELAAWGVDFITSNILE